MDALKKKPVPEEFTEHVVKLPKQDIIFKDLTSKVKINRADILKKIKPKETIVSTPSIPALTAEPSEHSSEIQDSISKIHPLFYYSSSSRKNHLCSSTSKKTKKKTTA